MMDNLKDIQPFLVIILICAALIQGCWIFWDASKRGENKWLWGFFGILNIPSNIIVYLIVTRIVIKPNPCKVCGKNVRKNYRYCPYCGEEQNSQG